MASTATLVDTIQSTGLPPIKEYQVVLDGSNPVDILTPTHSTDRVFVVGAQFSDSQAATLEFLSAASKTMTLELAANQGNYDVCKLDGFLFATKPGEKLTLDASAAITQITLFLVEAKDYAQVVGGLIR